MAYGTILVIRHTRIATLKITGFPIIIIHRVKAVSFKITSLTTAAIKLRSFLKRTIGLYIASGQIEIAF